MPSQDRLAALEAKLEARLKNDGNPKAGYSKNVAALRQAIGQLRMLVNRPDPVTPQTAPGTTTEDPALEPLDPPEPAVGSSAPVFRKPAAS